MEPSDSRLWSFAADMSLDGQVTISDIWLWFSWAYFYPGDLVVAMMLSTAPGFARFFEMTPAGYGASFSGVVSFFAWVLVVLLVQYVAASAEAVADRLEKNLRHART
jgi:hypothetical protein